MKNYRNLGLLVLLMAAALALVSCGGSSTAQQEEAKSGSEKQGSQGSVGDMPGMDHSNMPSMGGTDQGSMDAEEMSRQMVRPNGEYSDAAFVDAMVPHHEGAVEMALVALENAEHEEVRTLAQDIVSAQRAEIDLFGEIREELGGEAMMEMSEEEMEGMMGNMDAGELANQRPFDRAFIDAMIPHHESAIAMAEVALEESEDPEIREIAQDIVDAQEREISQLRQWRAEWYPEEA